MGKGFQNLSAELKRAKKNKSPVSIRTVHGRTFSGTVLKVVSGGVKVDDTWVLIRTIKEVKEK